MVIEGNRFFTMKNIEWVVSGFESKMYVLQVSQMDGPWVYTIKTEL